MPTGYTAPIYEGKDITLFEYAASCAHAFGAFIHQRDSGTDSTLTYPPYPDTSYYAEALEKAKADKFRWETYSEEDKYVLWSEYYKEQLVSNAKRLSERAAMRSRYLDMIAQVESVDVPSKLANFKEFMLSQLTDSMKFDCPAEDRTDTYYTPREFAEWCADYDKKVVRDIEYYSRELAKEWERYNERVEYINLMKDTFGFEVVEREEG